jgi:hypothetical protein
MATRRMPKRRSVRLRAKLSTTVARETYVYLEGLVARGAAVNLAEALDLLVKREVEHEQRAELDRRVAEYYANLPDEQTSEQRLWGEFSEREMAGPARS